MTPQLVVVLAANGLGHARRMLGVLGCFVERGGAVDLTIVGEPWQRAAARGWRAGELVEAHGARWHHGIVEPGVRWSTAGDRYRDGALLQWEARLDDVPELGTADVVVSDNLVGVLTRRPDALLAASFLWSDVLDAIDPSSPEVEAFVDHERELLAAHQPEMLCVRDLVMPGVLERTRPHPVGWMCEDPSLPSTPPADGGAVAVLGGGTGAADDLLRAAAGALADAGTPVLTGDSLTGTGLPRFDRTPAAWRSVAAVVCRPGAGTLTDCVRWQVPVVCVDEGGNAEMTHNAVRISALGFGVDAGRQPDVDATVSAVQRVSEPSPRAATREAMALVDRRGLEEAADWLAVHCRVSLRTAVDQQGEAT